MSFEVRERPLAIELADWQASAGDVSAYMPPSFSGFRRLSTLVSISMVTLAVRGWKMAELMGEQR